MSAVTLDHLILPVNDREASLAFYTQTLGFAYAGERPLSPCSTRAGI